MVQRTPQRSASGSAPKYFGFIRLMSRWPLQVRALELSGEKNRPLGIRATRGVIWTFGPALSLSNGAPNDFSRPSESRSTPIHYSEEPSILRRPPSDFCCVTSVLHHREYDIPVRRSTCDIRDALHALGLRLPGLCGCVLVGFLIDFGRQ